MVACFMFAGCLRSCEILTATSRRYVSDCTLLNKDVSVKTFNGVSVLVICLRNTKEMQSDRKHTMVEMFQNGLYNDPVSSYLAWKRIYQGQPDQPLVSLRGRGLTRSQLNSMIRELLDPVMEYGPGEAVLSHSFRAGLATSLARVGASEEEIKRQGRWTSESYARLVDS